MENEYKAYLSHIEYSARFRQIKATFRLNSNAPETEATLSQLWDKELLLGFEPYSPEKSLTANAYFHVLCRKIGAAVGRTETYIKNKIISRAGQDILQPNGERWEIVSPLSVEEIWEQEEIHAKPIGVKLVNGEYLFEYALKRKSRTYNRREFSRLIDEAVQEAKEAGVETLPPAELERMLKEWKARTE